MPVLEPRCPRILVVVGTRPEAIKMGPVVRELRRRSEEVECTVVNTGQHPVAVAAALGLAGVEADVDLAVHRPGQTPNDVMAAVLDGMAPHMDRHRPDAVLVHGDTSSAAAAALHAFNRRVPVVHIEAGLRTGDLDQPFPEEANRRVISVCARLHLAPTTRAEVNLIAEGVPVATIVVTGNTGVDALHAVLAEHPVEDPVVRGLVGHPGRLAVATLHRRENWSSLAIAADAIREVVDRHADLRLVLPVHPNPDVHRVLRRSRLADHPRVTLCDPLSYVPFAHLLARSELVLTDSGGVQEEAGSLGVPVVVMRDVTERPELLASGLGRLAGCSRARIVEHATDLLGNPPIVVGDPPFGDGRAAPRCVDAVLAMVRATDRPQSVANAVGS